MDILAVIVTGAKDNKIVFAEGVDDGNTDVQIIIPRALVNAETVELILKDELPFSAESFERSQNSSSVNLGSLRASFAVGTYGDFKVEIKRYPVSALSDFTQASDQSEHYVTALVAYDSESNALLFAEGADPDGYSFHQVCLNDDSFAADILSIAGQHIEAKDLCGTYGRVVIAMKRFKA